MYPGDCVTIALHDARAAATLLRVIVVTGEKVVWHLFAYLAFALVGWWGDNCFGYMGTKERIKSKLQAQYSSEFRFTLFL